MSVNRFINFYQVKKILDDYETIELESAPKSYFYAIDIEQIEERSKKSDIKKIIQLNEMTNDEKDELASLLFMEGSDLPKLKNDEVEIARLSFGTIIGNTYSLRAEWLEEDMVYRIVGETKGFDIVVPIKSSKQPLTLRQIILQFEEAEPSVGLNDLVYALKNEDDDFDFANYIKAESAFYSGFSQFYKFASKELIKNYK